MLNSKDTGGQAFPDWPESAFPSTFKSIDDKEQIHRWGMTLRDYFAAKAIGVEDATLRPAYTFEEQAKYAYMMADAMLKAREQ